MYIRVTQLSQNSRTKSQTYLWEIQKAPTPPGKWLFYSLQHPEFRCRPGLGVRIQTSYGNNATCQRFVPRPSRSSKLGILKGITLTLSAPSQNQGQMSRLTSITGISQEDFGSVSSGQFGVWSLFPPLVRTAWDAGSCSNPTLCWRRGTFLAHPLGNPKWDMNSFQSEKSLWGFGASLDTNTTISFWIWTNQINRDSSTFTWSPLLSSYAVRVHTAYTSIKYMFLFK